MLKSLRDDSFVNAALLPDVTKAAIRRAFARRREEGCRENFSASQDGIDHFLPTDISMHVGDVEAVVCIGVGKATGFFRRRVKTYWIFVARREGAHFFPVSSHETGDSAAEMLTAIHAELAAPI